MNTRLVGGIVVIVKVVTKRKEKQSESKWAKKKKVNEIKKTEDSGLSLFHRAFCFGTKDHPFGQKI